MMSQAQWNAARTIRGYRALSEGECSIIRTMHDTGASFSAIGRAIGRARGTICTTVDRWDRQGTLVGRRNRVAMRPGANPASPVSVAGSANQATVFPMYSSPIRFAVETGKAITPNTSLSAESNIGPAQ